MKNGSLVRQLHLKRKFIPLLVAACFSGAGAAPSLPQVVSGQATFAQQGNVFSITNTPNAIIDWQSFSVNPGEITRFVQQNANSAVLNRIVGQDPSQILGALQSNGHVFLINPNGILFGRDARVDVNGLVASTLNLGNADFLAGNKNFSAGASAGTVVNQGAITTPAGGQVFLIAPGIENSGIITSPQGQVVLAAGHSVQLVDSANPDLHVVVSAPDSQAVNLGQLIAQGGQVGIYGALVRQRGLVSADSAVLGENGKIVLRASRDTLLEAGSVTSATGAGSGGQVSVLGERVALTGDARIDASGVRAGGTVLVGGDYQGGNPLLPNAQQAWMGSAARISADASAGGSGGKVVLWSSGATRALGTISARGGLVETSGHYLDLNGARVDAGTWLLDPLNIEVVASGGGLLSDADLFATASTATTLIDPSKFAGASGNVVLQALNDIKFTNDVSVAAGKSLTAQAGNNITVNANIATSGAALTLSAGDPGGTQNAAGSVFVNGALGTGGGQLGVTGYNIAFGTAGIANSGNGGMDFRAAGTLTLGGYASLSGNGNINIKADNLALDGTIGSASGAGAGPLVSFNPVSDNRAIVIETAKTTTGLSISPGELNRISGSGISIGSSVHTGALTVASDYTAASGKTASLVLESAGNISIAGQIDLNNNAGSKLLIGRYGANDGGLQVNAGAALKAESIILRSDSIALAGPVSGGTGGSVVLAPNNLSTAILLGGTAADTGGVLGLSQADLDQVSANKVAIGGQTGQTGSLTVSGATVFPLLTSSDTVALAAGEGSLVIDAGLTAPGRLVLQSNTAISENSGGLIMAPALEVHGGSVYLSQPNLVDEIAGASGATVNDNFFFTSALDLAVGTVGSTTGISTMGGYAWLESYGVLEIAENVFGNGGKVYLHANGILNDVGALVDAGALIVESTAGVGLAGSPLNTKVNYLSVLNTQDNASNPINISNTGELVLGRVIQSGIANGGAITIDNTGGMTLPYTDANAESLAEVRTASGPLTLLAHSPLTIEGTVASTSGNISLEAGNGGTLTISTSGKVASNSGNITLTAGAIANSGTVTTSGAISKQVPTTTLPPPAPEPDPTVSSCLDTPTSAACVVLLQEALVGCIANPAGPDCAAVLPPISQCIADPSTAGCSAVLPTLATCEANPAAAGCSVVLPSLPACSADPSTPGCSVVLPTLAACIADPSAPGCTVVLPALSACISNPSAPGCAVVLPALSACIANPSAPGCSVVLPTLSACIANPAAAGCTVVLPTLAACVSNPSAAGCSVVLPTLAACTAAPSTAGCAVVLPTLSQCIAAPSQGGCAVVLPSLSQCVSNPVLAGCSVILPSLSACTANPVLGGCAVVLPTLAQCITTPSQAGCSAVLPALSQCTLAPSLAGCQVVLPTLAQCAATPTLQGCSVVVPAPSSCVENPAQPACMVVSPEPPASKGVNPVAQEIATTVNLINTVSAATAGASSEAVAEIKLAPKKDGTKLIATAEKDMGVKNEPAKKMYCN